MVEGILLQIHWKLTKGSVLTDYSFSFSWTVTDCDFS